MPNGILQILKWTVTCAALITASPSIAAEPVPLKPTGKPLFAPYDTEAKAGENVSGATCFDDGSCVLVADEMIAVQRIELDLDGPSPAFNAGRTYGLIFGDHCTDIEKKKKCEEVDLEAIARDGRGILVAGSMGNKSKSGKRAKDRWFLARFSIDQNGEPKAGTLEVQSKRGLLKRLFSGHKLLDPFIEKPLQCGGVNIEGMALVGDQIYFGLRSPAERDKGRAYIVQSPDTVLKADRKSDVALTRLHVLTFRDTNGQPVRGVGIRALEPFGDRLLIATGDAGVSAPDTEARLKDIKERCATVPGGAALANTAGQEPLTPRIWIWDPASQSDPVEVAALEGAYADEKLEGIAVLNDPPPSADRIDLLLTIDGQNDVPALALLRGLEIPQ